MLKLGIIGTGWISAQFVEAAMLTGNYTLSAVYSRTLVNAEKFAANLSVGGVEIFDDLTVFVAADLDVIYIASPNSAHFEQAKAVLSADKSVIVEKPAFSNPHELTEIIQLADKKQLFFFEAARNIHEAAFQTVKDFLADKTIVGADLTYAKYSSKMPALLAGELPNKWNPAMSGGILADLGVYLLYFSLGIFGKPEAVSYDAQLLPTGVDVSGTGLLDYADFTMTMKAAGNFTSYLPSEIYTTDGTLILDGISAISEAIFVSHDGVKETLDIPATADNPLFEEAGDFAAILSAGDLTGKNFQSWQALAKAVSETSLAMRQDAGIIFAADKK